MCTWSLLLPRKICFRSSIENFKPLCNYDNKSPSSYTRMPQLSSSLGKGHPQAMLRCPIMFPSKKLIKVCIEMVIRQSSLRVKHSGTPPLTKKISYDQVALKSSTRALNSYKKWPQGGVALELSSWVPASYKKWLYSRVALKSRTEASCLLQKRSIQSSNPWVKYSRPLPNSKVLINRMNLSARNCFM